MPYQGTKKAGFFGFLSKKIQKILNFICYSVVSGKVKNLGLSELLRIYLLKFIYKSLTEATNVRGLKDIEGS